MSSFPVLTPAINRMRRLAAASGIVFGVMVAVVPAKAELPPPGLADLVSTLMPSVVNITSRSLEPVSTGSLNAATTPQASSGLTPEQRSKTALGSGFVIDPSGIIVTNNHVIENAFDVSVTFQDGTFAHAKVMATSKIGDIALLKVDVGAPLPALHFGDSTVMRVGDPVIAIGNPLGFGGSVTTGIVSALNRDIMISPFDDFIQTDASLNHGNSGGPLFNRKGEVIGVNTALYTPTNDGGSIGIGFAIPAFCVQFVVGHLREYGVVRAGMIGLGGQDVTADIAKGADLPAASRAEGTLPGSAGWGVIVTNIVTGGPAAAAGIQEGDILQRVDGAAISDVRSLARMVAIHPLNQTITLSIWRGGQQITATPVVGEWLGAETTDKAALASTASQRVRSMDLGLRLAALTSDNRMEHKLAPDQSGVLITRVMPDSIAGDRGLAEGDVIVKVMTRPVLAPDDLIDGLKTMIDDHHSMALLLVKNSAGVHWVPFPLTDKVAEAVVNQKG